jgi:hypothetical protein
MTAVDSPEQHPLFLATADGGPAVMARHVVAAVDEWLETGSRQTTAAGNRLRHWRLAADHYKAGDYAHATVHAITHGGGLQVALISDVIGHVRPEDLPPARSHDLYGPGDRVTVRLRTAPDPGERRFSASLREIPSRIKPKAPPKLEPDTHAVGFDSDVEGLDAPGLRCVANQRGADIFSNRSEAHFSSRADVSAWRRASFTFPLPGPARLTDPISIVRELDALVREMSWAAVHVSVLRRRLAELVRPPHVSSDEFSTICSRLRKIGRPKLVAGDLIPLVAHYPALLTSPYAMTSFAGLLSETGYRREAESLFAHMGAAESSDPYVATAYNAHTRR